MYTNFPQPCILGPIDNIFVNATDKNIYSRNIRYKVSDHIHMPNFLLFKGIMETKKYQKLIRDMKNFSRKKYLKELEEINAMLLLQCNNVNKIF